MTKKIRIENADTSDWKVVVQQWERGQNNEPDRFIAETELNNPTDLKEFLIWKEKYLIIKETGSTI